MPPKRPRKIYTVYDHDTANIIVTQAWEAYHAEIVRFLTGRIHNATEADDLATEVFLKLQEAVERGEWDSSKPIVKLLYTLAKYAALTWWYTYQYQDREDPYPAWDLASDRGEGFTELNWYMNPAEYVCRMERITIVRSWLARLPLPAQRMLIAHYVDRVYYCDPLARAAGIDPDDHTAFSKYKYMMKDYVKDHAHHLRAALAVA